MMIEPVQSVALSPRVQAVANRIDGAVSWLATHWQAGFISIGAFVFGLATLSPVLLVAGHETAARSYHVLGEQMAFCQRDLAINGGAQLAGLCESLPELRLLSGSLVSIGAGWFLLARLETGCTAIRDEIECRVMTWHIETPGRRP